MSTSFFGTFLALVDNAILAATAVQTSGRIFCIFRHILDSRSATRSLPGAAPGAASWSSTTATLSRQVIRPHS